MSRSMLKGIHRRAIGVGNDDEILIPKGVVAGGDGKPAIFSPSPDTVALHEDFLAKAIPNVTDSGYAGHFFTCHEGDSGMNVSQTAYSNGVFSLAGTATATASPTKGQGFSGLVIWAPDPGAGAQARLRMTARLKLTQVSRAVGNRQAVFVGFTDEDKAEMPILDSGFGIVSNATNAMGFLFGTKTDTGWNAVAVNANTDRTPVTALHSPTANVYHTLEVEYHRGINDTGGTATYYVNGAPLATITSPVDSDTKLCPMIYRYQEDTGVSAVDVDYVSVSQIRDTGT